MNLNEATTQDIFDELSSRKITHFVCADVASNRRNKEWDYDFAFGFADGAGMRELLGLIEICKIEIQLMAGMYGGSVDLDDIDLDEGDLV